MRAIAMCYGRQPVVRTVVGSNDNVVYLIDASALDANIIDSKSGVGFPHSFVYQFEEERFIDLEAAWKAGNEDALDKLWTNAPKLNLHENVGR